MLQDRPTDEQIAAQEERIAAREARTIRAVVATLLSCGLLIAAIVLLALMVRANFIPAWLSDGLGTALFFAWLAYIFLRVKPGSLLPSLNDIDEDYLRNTIDFQQRRGRAAFAPLLWNLVFLGFVFTVTIVPMLRKHPEKFNPLFHTVFAVIAVVFAGLALQSVLILTYGGRRAAIDELSRAQRAKAGQFGHILAVTELAALLLASAYRPQWVITSLPLAIATAVALPGAYFLYLEWRSGRG